MDVDRDVGVDADLDLEDKDDLLVPRFSLWSSHTPPSPWRLGMGGMSTMYAGKPENWRCVDSLEKEEKEEEPSLDLEARSEFVSVDDLPLLLHAARGVRSLALSLLLQLPVMAKSNFFSVRWDFLRFADASLGNLPPSESSLAMVGFA